MSTRFYCRGCGASGPVDEDALRRGELPACDCEERAADDLGYYDEPDPENDDTEQQDEAEDGP